MATNIFNINPERFTLEDYSSSDLTLIPQFPTITTFNPSTDYIEFYIYNLNGSILYPQVDIEAFELPFTGYRIQDNNLILYPDKDLEYYGYTRGSYNVLYNFISNRCGSSKEQKYFISEISSNRTELRLASTTLPGSAVRLEVNNFIEERNSDQYYPDFYLNFGQNQLIIANNIALDGDTILIKLYEPLPQQYSLKSQCYIVEEVANSVAFNVQIVPDVIEIDDSIQIQGPNLNIKLKDEISNSGSPQDWLSLTSTDLTSSAQQVSSYYEDPNIAINVDYTDYSNFINFSSAKSRISNFFYKLQQIESWTTQSEAGGNQSGAVVAVSASVAFFQNKINETIDQFDNFEYYLYFSSGSVPYPKSNSSLPYEQVSTTSVAAQTWITASLISGSNYDTDNLNWIYWAIPEYIREDNANANYIAFCNMVSHFYDENIWVYIKDITNKWNNDNRVNAGISPDLIAQQLRDLGFTIYENQFSSFNIYSSLLGITPSGSTFPYPDMTGSLPTPSGYQYIDNFVTGSNEVLPQDDVNKRLYKRMYNALPYIYKKKGTVDGIRALITAYGIPNTLLQINEFGGKDKDNTNDWDYWFEQFNYQFNTNTDGWINSDWDINSEWGATDNVPDTLEFRFKTPGLQSGINTPNQVLWSLESNAYILLEYTGSGYTSGSFSGSTPDPYNEYATLKFVPDWFSFPNISASIYLPFFNGDWWSVAVTRTQNNGNLYAANSIYSGSNGSSIGFTASSSLTFDPNQWINGNNSYFPSVGRTDLNGYSAFSGSYQEIRYYSVQLSQSVFDDYVMNPQSIEGNTINSAPDELVFRASLGGELYTGSVSIHPKVTGSWTPINSFTSDSNFTITGGGFTSNTEYVLADQPAVGIKNRISDKIKAVSLDLPEGNQQLSNIASIQQNSIGNQAYTPNIDLLEVVFSPTNQINDDILNSIGYLNIGEYIGDPRQQISGSFTYPDLDHLRDDYFLKYTKSYDWADFTNLVRFFDNSLFKLIKDYVPAKTSLASGVSIKQHLLERNKYPEPQVSRSFHELTGSIGQIPYLLDDQRAYSASTDYQSFPIVVPSGSQGGTLPNFVLDTNYTDFDYPGAINVTQSWVGSNVTPFGYELYTQDDAREFIDGEFSGSTLVVTTQSLNPGCDPFKTPDTTQILYNVVSLANNAGGTNLGTYPQRSFGFFLNPPATQFGTDGDIVLWWNAKFVGLGETLSFAWSYSVEAIKIFKESANGINSGNYLGELTNIIINTNTFTFLSTSDYVNTTTSTIECTVLSISEYPDFYLYYVTPTGVINFESDAGQPDGIGINEQTDKLSVLTPYVPSTFFNSDCNAVINNALIPRQSEIFWDLDYQSNAIQAVNQQVIISASQQGTTLPKAFVQDYNWYSTPITTRNYKGSKNTVEAFNTGSGYNSQVSAGTYIGFYSRIQSVGNFANIWITHLITPDNVVIANTQDEQWINLLESNFCKDANENPTAYSLPFSSSIDPQIFPNLQVFTNNSGNVYLRASGSSAFTGEYGKGGGMIYPNGLTLTSANTNLQKGFTTLRNSGVITSGTGN
jgi:hypothetical protein